jgi:acetyl-CoA C-acetyltransferase
MPTSRAVSRARRRRRIAPGAPIRGSSTRARRSRRTASATRTWDRPRTSSPPRPGSPASGRTRSPRAATPARWRLNRQAGSPIGELAQDQRPRAGFTVDRLARFPSAFTPGGTATAANSCGVNDGAAAVLVVSEQRRRELGLPGLRLVASATSGADPARLGLGAVPAMRRVLDRNPDVVEFNEAFAGQALACLDAAGLDEERVSPDGGAIALGHPWGASGAVLVVRLFTKLVTERAAATGLAALSSGGGLGVATMWEAVE